MDNGKFLVRVVYGDKPQSTPALPAEIPIVDDETLVHQGVGAFLKVFYGIQQRGEAAPSHAKNCPT
jgi:hypothetical protein